MRKVLIAGTGENAQQIQRACRALAVSTVQAFPPFDARAAYVRTAEEAVCIGPPSGDRDAHSGQAILLAALTMDADAIHPGDGPLAEDADFARMVEEFGLIFIGPSSAVIRQVSDRISAKRIMQEVGVLCALSGEIAVAYDHAATAIGRAIGYPLVVKTARDHGDGLHVVRAEADLHAAITAIRTGAEHRSAGAVYLEQYLAAPRHVEIQVLADAHGNCVWLGERDCSLRQGYRTIIAETPAVGVSAELIAAIGERCASACRRIRYHGVGTFTFLYEGGALLFIGMQARLQPQHTVTEAITGIDIAQAQLRVARGEPLQIVQDEVRRHGHAIACFIRADDPVTARSFLRVVSSWDTPSGPGIRVDSHVVCGDTLPRAPSRLAMVSAHGSTRDEALLRLRVAVAEFRVEGVGTNLPMLRSLLEDPVVSSGGPDSRYLERWLSKRERSPPPEISKP
ncbi:biotin carboxylase N-terminal domain-containing protein [uncultured Methylobacterium sp.]|jgi:acetyl-CoA carboxylase biotin carboxylase subunit|uniref:ATP-binding protein n=1 Tax=uncultured Methylobacterium sp. TaxID=157278 RepID=UPI002632CD56|nr:biotin carboxylase N-terminal domain-containing protein [uncultured Methylobacterium sp.]